MKDKHQFKILRYNKNIKNMFFVEIIPELNEKAREININKDLNKNVANNSYPNAGWYLQGKGNSFDKCLWSMPLNQIDSKERLYKMLNETIEREIND